MPCTWAGRVKRANPGRLEGRILYLAVVDASFFCYLPSRTAKGWVAPRAPGLRTPFRQEFLNDVAAQQTAEDAVDM